VLLGVTDKVAASLRDRLAPDHDLDVPIEAVEKRDQAGQRKPGVAAVEKGGDVRLSATFSAAC
jgi:hypothetical protein